MRKIQKLKGKNLKLEIWQWDALSVVYVIVGIALGIIMVISGAIPRAYAAQQDWVQTDWSGGASPGVVTTSVSTFDSATGIVSSLAGQVSLDTKPGWLDPAWNYRSTITITNSGGTTYTDYQTLLKINTSALILAGKMSADCADLRITDSGGIQLPYWIETGIKACNTTDTYIWTKVASVPSGNTNLYIYYGNPAAANVINGTNVFGFFDDFEDGAIDPAKWSQGVIAATTGTNFSESAGKLQGGNSNRYLQSISPFTGDYIAEARVYETTSVTNGFSSVGFWASTANSWGILIHNGTLYTRNNSGWVSFGAFSKSKWTRDYVQVLGTAGSASRTAEDLSEQRTYSATNTGGISSEYLRLGSRYDNGVYNQNYVASWDWIFVRKAVTTPPTVGTLGAEETKYASSGTLTSNVFDPGYATDWSTLSYTTTEGVNVTVLVRSDVNADMSTAPAWGTCTGVASGTDLSSTSCVADTERYVQYQMTMTPNGATSPVFQDITISYEASDLVPPTTNATNVAMTGVVDGSWSNVEPTFTWTAGADNAGGSGMLGYCIALDEADIGSPNTLDPAITAGKLTGIDDGVASAACPYIVIGTGLNLSSLAGLTLVSGKQYYFSIKAVDIPGNIWTGPAGQFQELVSFKYDNTPPNNPGFISLPANFISSKDFTFTWPTSGADAPSDAHSGLAGMQYRIGNNGTWYGDTHSGSEDLADLLLNDGSYTSDPTTDYPNLAEGNNYIYVRTWDVLGNVSTTYTTGVIKINTVAPSQVNNLNVSPTDNTMNAYAFSWNPPNTYTGQLNNMTYCYTVNTLPGAGTCNYTTAGVTNLAADAYATQPGANVMYVVARDEAFNINYDVYSSVQFSYSGSAPGLPTNVDIADISIKATSSWKLALTWDAPLNVGAGIAAYRIFRSTTSNSCSAAPAGFAQVGSSSNSSYVDSGLSQTTYYYCVKACDSANNCSAYSTTVSEYPTGKFTEPATLLVEPQITGTTTRRGVVNWVTDRGADSRVEYGLTSGNYFGAEVGSSDQVTDHKVELNNLTAGTTYYYRVKWTDEDGNTGMSTEKIFSTNPAPLVKGIAVVRVDLTSALIHFTSTGASKVRVLFGQSTGFGGLHEIQTSPVESTYTVVLDGLNDGTVYYYKIDPVDSEGFEYEGSVLDFTTLPRPKISNVQIQEVKGTAQPTVEVFWESNTEVSSIITYAPVDTPALTREVINLDLIVGKHSAQIAGLQASTAYTLVVKGLDKLGNEGESTVLSFNTATDSRPPAISNLVVEGTIVTTAASGEGQAQLIVTWDTDEPATSQVEFGVGSYGEYTQRTQIDANPTYNHLVVVSNLTPAQVYHLRAVASDSSFNQSESGDTVTITPKLADSAFDLVVNNLLQIFGFLGS